MRFYLNWQTIEEHRRHLFLDWVSLPICWEDISIIEQHVEVVCEVLMSYYVIYVTILRSFLYGWCPACRSIFNSLDMRNADECSPIPCRSASLTRSIDSVLFMGEWLLRGTMSSLNVMYNWIKSTGSKFADRFRSTLLYTIEWGIVNYYTIITCACVILLDGIFLLLIPSSIYDEFVYYGTIG